LAAAQHKRQKHLRRQFATVWIEWDPTTQFDECVDQEQNEGGATKALFDNDFEPFAASGTAASAWSNSDSDLLLLKEKFPFEDLPAGLDSFSPTQQLHVMLGSKFHDERNELAGDDEMRQSEESGAAEATADTENEEEDMLELDAQEHALLDLLELCKDAGTSLEFFDNLVTILRQHGKKGFDVWKASDRQQTFLDDLRKKISCPCAVIIQVGPHQVPKFNLLEQITDLFNSVHFDDAGNLCVNLSL
jgi:hypothetical protein